MAAQDYFEARLTELAERAGYAGRPTFTRFLDPAQLAQAQRIARTAGVSLFADGGLPDAERRIVAFADQAPDPDAYPLVLLEATWDARYASVGHRDLLGAEMALGLSRDLMGDIQLNGGRALLACHRDISDELCRSLTDAGRARLRLNPVDRAAIASVEPSGRVLRVTVSSPRLDAVLAEAFGFSRAKAQALIARALVKVNYLSEVRTDVHMAEQDLVSLRGFGRFRVKTALGETKKGRLAYELFLYTDDSSPK